MKKFKLLSEQLLNTNNLFFYIYVCIVSIGLNYAIQYNFFTEELYYNTFGEQLTINRIHELFELGSRYKIVNYLLIPIILVVRILYNSFWISIGSYLNNNKIEFESIFNVCLKSEIIFVLMRATNLIILLFFKDVSNLYDLNPIPFSVYELYHNSVSKWLEYPLQTANIWEILFCIFGSLLFALKTKVNYQNALLVFSIPYLIGLFVWITFVVFIILHLS